jgi:DNA-directed RNA polymerase subunit RPC12/RpoP
LGDAKDTTEFEVMIPKGNIVTCPKCESQIAKVTKDLHKFEQITADCFEGIEQEIKPLDPMTCKRCGSPWFSGGRLHTEKGWM